MRSSRHPHVRAPRLSRPPPRSFPSVAVNLLACTCFGQFSVAGDLDAVPDILDDAVLDRSTGIRSCRPQVSRRSTLMATYSMRKGLWKPRLGTRRVRGIAAFEAGALAAAGTGFGAFGPPDLARPDRYRGQAAGGVVEPNAGTVREVSSLTGLLSLNFLDLDHVPDPEDHATDGGLSS